MLETILKSVSSGKSDKPVKPKPISVEQVKSVEQALGSCPGCQGGSFWEPRFQDGVWKCVECEPAPSPVLVGRTRQIQGCRPQISNSEPFVVCMGMPVCDSCLSTHLEVFPVGYRCGTCGCAIAKSSDEIFFVEKPKIVEQKNNRKYFGR